MEKLKLKPITELLGDQFNIPSYQRGYRWKKEQVQNLLNDIWSFRQKSQNENNEVFYCLQPVVVSSTKNGWELIDGQQRITTILIIMQCLKNQMLALEKTPYTIAYATRTGSEAFLANLSRESLAEREINVDYYHICEAFDAVNEWFAAKDGNTKIHFLTTLLNDDVVGKNVKVIWYDVSEENISNKLAIDIFTRLNIGKIPLTNAELVKALFLMKTNFGDQATLKQLQIASEWDLIEKRLQDDSFWHFIFKRGHLFHYENRIEFIFDLMQEKTKDDEDHFTFIQFSKQLQRSKDSGNKHALDELWLSVKQYFLTLEEWFNDRELYHLIGFLIEYGADISVLRTKFKECRKQEFVDYLKSEIKFKLRNVVIEDLSYPDDKDEIRRVLLLFNLQTIISTRETDLRFPFHRYKRGKWDIEHVNSQTEKSIDLKSAKTFAQEILTYFTGVKRTNTASQVSDVVKSDMGLEEADVLTWEDNEPLKELCLELIQVANGAKIDENALNNLYSALRSQFKETSFESNDSICNLALLDQSTNRSFGNAFFPIKRERIISNDKDGLFVPICTKNLFLKYYSRRMKDVMYWQQADADDYLAAIKNTLDPYLTPHL